MEKDRKGRAWLWGLLVLALAGLIAYLIISEMAPQVEDTVEDTVVESETPQVEIEDTTPIRQPVTEEKGDISPPSIKKKIFTTAEQEEDYCAQIENSVAEFFLYLDQKEYIRNLDLEVNVYVHTKEILKRLSARPPVPAGEGADPRIIIGNLYHFFRILKGKDIQLVKEVVRNEDANLEINLEMFYMWFMLGDRCPNPENVRPSFDVLYKYAGFLVNTTGGRAYLFRRPTPFRLLVSYYCLLVIQEADKRGKNTSGIDISPYIASLREEIIHYPDFQFQKEFVYRLSRLEDYYSRRR